MSEYACAKCGIDPTTREGWAAIVAKTRSECEGEHSPDGKRYCWACWGCWRADHWSKEKESAWLVEQHDKSRKETGI